MATSKSQRIGIAIILAVTVIGTLGSFAVMVLAQDNQTKEAAKQQSALADYQAKYAEYQNKVEAQDAELSSKYYDKFKEYAPRVGEFNLEENNKELKFEDLLVGEGEEIKDETKFAAYYIGWNPSGKIFDQSIDEGKLKSPLPIADGLKNASLIEGWKEAMKGMKIGGVREVTIPSDKAYKETGQGDDIPPNTPLRFVIMAIDMPAQIDQPEYPASLMQRGGLYGY